MTTKAQIRTKIMNIFPSSVESWNTLFQAVSVILVAGTVLAGFGTIITGRIVSRNQTRDLAQANAEAAKANKGVADTVLEIEKAKEETARLTKETETAKTERVEADKQIAIAKADAARAKEGIANAEAQSAQATLEVTRLRGIVANAEQRRAEAEKALLELQERMKPRRVTAEQRQQAINVLMHAPKGRLEIQCHIGSPEIQAFGAEIVEIFRTSGWEIDLNDRALIIPAPVGLKLWIHTEHTALEDRMITENVPERTQSILNAFRAAKIPVQAQFNHDVPKDILRLIVGFKP